MSGANRERRPGSVPQTNGEGTRTREGTWAVMTRNISPTNPVGVQLARAIVPWRRNDADELARRAGRVGREHHAEHRRGRVELAVAEGQRVRIGLREPDVQPFRVDPLARPVEESGT